MDQYHWLLIFGWVFFGLLHSLLASLPVKKVAQKFMGPHYVHYRKGYSLFSFAQLTALLYYQVSINTISLFKAGTVAYLLGVLFCMAGLSIMLKCAHEYAGFISGPGDLTGAREEKKELLLKGLHARMRHPLYFGTLCLAWGLVIIFPALSNFIAAGMLSCYTLVGIYFEEKKLVKQFGDVYVKYRRVTPMLIPFPAKRRFHRISAAATFNR